MESQVVLKRVVSTAIGKRPKRPILSPYLFCFVSFREDMGQFACVFRFFSLKFCIFAQENCNCGRGDPKFNVKHILFTAELFIYIKKEVDARMFLGILRVPILAEIAK